MMEEMGIDPVESITTSYEQTLKAFTEASVIGNIQKFLAALKLSKEAFEVQMTPDNYNESFLEERDSVEEGNEETVIAETNEVVNDIVSEENTEEPKIPHRNLLRLKSLLQTRSLPKQAQTGRKPGNLKFLYKGNPGESEIVLWECGL